MFITEGPRVLTPILLAIVYAKQKDVPQRA